jgi:uncharacterized damage-inducible protein DinB
MITSQEIADSYALNLRLIKLQTDGLSHDDSLVQTAYNINSLNWVLGHIAVNRDNVLRAMDEESLLSGSESARYKRGSEPVKADDGLILPLESLLDVLERGQGRITEILNDLSVEDMEREIQSDGNTVSLGSRLFGLYFHDTYHTGQTDLLRQVAGNNDAVIR